MSRKGLLILLVVAVAVLAPVLYFKVVTSHKSKPVVIETPVTPGESVHK
jgi:hypothetical protein